MALREKYLPVLDKYRAKLDTKWGLRQYDVLVRVRDWPSLPGTHGTSPTVVDTPLLVNGARPKVEQISQKDIIASGGLYQDQDLKIGPLTPPYTDNDGNPAGNNIDVFDPPLVANREVFFRITGPGMESGHWYTKVSMSIPKGNFHYSIVVRKSAVVMS